MFAAVLLVAALLPVSNFNPNAAQGTVGNEWMATEQGDALLPAAVGFTSSAVETVDLLTVPLGVTGGDCTILAEIFPAGDEVPGSVTTSTFLPNDDLQFAGDDSENDTWFTQAISPNNLYAEINDSSDATYIYYFGAQSGKRYRFNVATAGALWPANQRVVGGRVKIRANREEANGRLQVSYFDGTDTYVLGTVTATATRQNLSVRWPEYNPGTGLPWTRAQIQALDGAAAIQLRPINVGRHKLLKVYRASLELDWVTEDRVAVGRAELSDQDLGTATAFTLQTPNGGVDNWAKTATDYTVVLRRIDGFGLCRWRHLTETAEVSEALLRPDQNVGLPVESYVPVTDSRGMVSVLGDRVPGRGQTFWLTLTSTAVSADGQPYTGESLQQSRASGNSYQLVTTAGAGTYAIVRWLGTHDDLPVGDSLTVAVKTAGGAVVQSVTLTGADLDAIATPLDPDADDPINIYTLRLTPGAALSAATQYRVSFTTPADGGVSVLVADGGSGVPSYGGTSDQWQGLAPLPTGDAPLTLSTTPTAPTSFAAGTAQTPVDAAAEDGAGCTIDSIETIALGWTPTSLAGDFGRYEIQRLGFDGETWEDIYTPTDETVGVAVDWESRRGQTETYRARSVRNGDWVPSAWTAQESALASNGNEDVVIGSNHAQAAFAYVRDPDYDFTHPQAQETLALAGRYGQVVLRESEDRGDTFPLPVVLFAGEDANPEPTIPGRYVFEPLRDFLRTPVPHFAVSDRDGWRWFADVAMPESSRTESASNYRATLQVTETQQQPTPFDGGGPAPAIPLMIPSWHAALNGRDTNPATIFCLGDSVTEGLYAASLTTRWVEILQADLRTALPTTGTTGGLGYRAAYYVANTLTDPTTSGTPIVSAIHGFGFRKLILEAGPESVTFVGSGTDATIWYQTHSSSPLKVEYNIDGGAYTEIDQTLAGNKNIRSVNISLGASGAHTVIVRWKSGAASGSAGFEIGPNVAGVQWFDGDLNKGIHVIEAGHTGFRALNFVNADIGGGRLYIRQQMSETLPDLCVLFLGFNEFLQDNTPADYRTYMDQLVGDLRNANPTRPIVLIAGWTPDATQAYPWDAYMDEAREIAEGPNLYLVDMTDGWPQPGTPSAIVQGLYQDGLHLSAEGHVTFGHHLAGLLGLP